VVAAGAGARRGWVAGTTWRRLRRRRGAAGLRALCGGGWGGGGTRLGCGHYWEAGEDWESGGSFGRMGLILVFGGVSGLYGGAGDA
jgi:hypothetical protein